MSQTNQRPAPSEADAEEVMLFKDLTEEQARHLRAYVDGPSPSDWSQEEVFYLHSLLLEDLSRLASPEAPLAEKMELLRWVFTNPAKERQPFSFANCLRVCCGYAESFPDPLTGTLSSDSVREELLHEMRPWLEQTLKRLPEWAQTVVREAPSHVAELLERNPQALNEITRRRQIQPDLFT